jgi:hypothetical protein
VGFCEDGDEISGSIDTRNELTSGIIINFPRAGVAQSVQ